MLASQPLLASYKIITNSGYNTPTAERFASEDFYISGILDSLKKREQDERNSDIYFFQL